MDMVILKAKVVTMSINRIRIRDIVFFSVFRLVAAIPSGLHMKVDSYDRIDLFFISFKHIVIVQVIAIYRSAIM